MILKTKCPYCSFVENSLKIDPTDTKPLLIRCASEACQKWYIGVIKISMKEYAINYGTAPEL